ncbi:MAG TPA: hypothetical protein VFJ72_04105 [Rubrobacteraceae bacterium]|nr:hypothetical protein [Rubrobacteraceae bacterium]
MMKIDGGLRMWAAVLVALAAGLVLVAAQSARAGAFPGVNGKIAFVSNRDGNDEIYTMNPDGTGLRQLTRTLYPSGNESPAVSPDGSRIVFERNKDVWIMNADGSGLRQLTTDGAFDHDPTFSPSGAKIAFLTRRGTDAPISRDNIWTMNTDGANQTRVTSNGAIEPTWSPNSDVIAFVRAGALWVTNLTTNTETQYTFTNTGNPDTSVGGVAFPTWSPNGSLIEFTGIGGALHCSCSGYFSVSAAGGAPTTIGPDDPSDKFLAFSPDGARIALQSTNRERNEEIYTMNPDGSGLTNISHDLSFTDNQPDWGPQVTQQSTSLSLSANPATITSGHSSTLSGRLVTASGKVYAGQRVTIQQKPKGASRFSNLKAVSTAFDGRFKTTVKPKKTTYYRAVFGGNGVLGLGASTSPARLVKVSG